VSEEKPKRRRGRPPKIRERPRLVVIERPYNFTNQLRKVIINPKFLYDFIFTFQITKAITNWYWIGHFQDRTFPKPLIMRCKLDGTEYTVCSDLFGTLSKKTGEPNLRRFYGGQCPKCLNVFFFYSRWTDKSDYEYT
jgi:hypothetical protein